MGNNINDILTEFGINCIVPSFLQGKNLDVMRSWKVCLSTLGLSRVYYEKSKHFHGLAFLKLEGEAFSGLCAAEAKREAAKMGRELEGIDARRELMVIPQDKEK